ncbi:Hydroxyacylglutathione hydrolase cytoplasmic [Smittium mucronatum]|uniref:hydroxyacylglutathione hydrolase n=1 Tax=Smittium mucronatum TaxID=133383 RepID=A0A1R0H913_9FUNG|nr:Hydroxyacylglutathione hydrolase cytoplasmic [Smittium mucronatum]
MRVIPVPVWSDNYAYLLVDDKTGINPVDPEKVIKAANEVGFPIKNILTTHHHGDHAGGNVGMTELVPGLTVYGGDSRIPAMNSQLNGGEEFSIGSLKIKAIKTYGHTDSSISYYVQDGEDKAVFTGDTLFIAGCGRLFEGNPEQMYESLNIKLGSLPQDTKVYVGHEYTNSNIKFALAVEPENEKLQEMAGIYAKSKMTVPSTIKTELETNPFMRVNQPGIQKFTGETDPVKVLGVLRSMKDRF